MSEPSELRATSDLMLDMVDRLRALEERKRDRVPGDADFTRLAWEIAELARTVLRWSELQLRQANEVRADTGRDGPSGDGDPGEPPRPLAMTEPRRLDVVLAEWRQAEIRLSQAPFGSREAGAAAVDAARLRTEYRRLQERKLDEHGHG
ncbi:MAG TPA: hypothetical protein VFY23_17290 [Candidatus Limnocylindrales bacterium]|nr:hypothetical protein [Candidatus Limnocylindrales bacterium]